MNKFLTRLKTLACKRSFWINTTSGALLVINQVTPFLPPQYIAGAAIVANILNRFVKVINEEPIQETEIKK